MRKLASIVSALTLVLFVSAASAQDAPKKGAAPPKDSGGDKSSGKVKTYDFSGDTIDGDLVKPEGSTVDAREFAKHSSLIRIRTNFIPEIIKSAEDL